MGHRGDGHRVWLYGVPHKAGRQVLPLTGHHLACWQLSMTFMSMFVVPLGKQQLVWDLARGAWAKSWTVWIITNCGKLLKRWECQIILPVS